jgi:hypothetical protein
MLMRIGACTRAFVAGGGRWCAFRLPHAWKRYGGRALIGNRHADQTTTECKLICCGLLRGNCMP